MEDTWLSIEDDSSHSASDSDRIDSETEADLYSTIHYQENISSHISKSVNLENDAIHSSSPAVSLSPQSNIICKLQNQQTDCPEEVQISHDKTTWLNKFKDDSNPFKESKTNSELTTSKSTLNSDDLEMDANESDEHISRKHSQSMTQCISSMEQSPKKRKSAIEVDFSDSDDSIIWTELDSLENSDFTTNLSKEDIDPIYLSSSDSDSEIPSVSSPTCMKRESVLKNLSMPNIKMGEKREGQWYVNNEDLYRSRKYSRRYHNNFELTCTNCNKKGHNGKMCPQPKVLKCFICGGGHVGSRCANRICGNCFQYGHERRRCQLGPNFFFCELCSRHGHSIQNCPDLWRRYHLTTEPVKIVQGKQVKQNSSVKLYCWNCGQNGHFGGVCQNGFSRYSVNTWPCVISYDDPREMFRRRLDDLRIRQNNFGWNEHLKYTESFKEAQEQRKKLIKQRKKKKAAKNKQKGKIKIEQSEKNMSNMQPEVSNKKEPKRKFKVTNKAIENCRKKIEASKKKIQNLVREKDFPRSPKQISPPQQTDEIPESVKILMKRQLKKERFKLRCQLKRQQRLTDLFASQSSTQVE